MLEWWRGVAPLEQIKFWGRRCAVPAEVAPLHQCPMRPPDRNRPLHTSSARSLALS